MESVEFAPCGKPGHFQIDEEDWEKVKAWMEERWNEARAAGEDHCSLGSELSFCFTPTSLGTITVVYWMRGTPKEQSLNLTNYSDW